MWVISAKNILQGDFEGKKFGQCKTQAVDHANEYMTTIVPVVFYLTLKTNSP